jgi:hypothetical protein
MEGGIMTTILTNEEKINIIDQHIKTVEYSIYGTELDLIEANAVSFPDTQLIAALDARLVEAGLRKSALESEKASLTTSEEA